MSDVTLDLDVYKWLSTIGVITVSLQAKANAKVTLDSTLSRQFMNGCKFAELIHAVLADRAKEGENIVRTQFNQFQPQLPPSQALKDGPTPGIRLYNWNLINDMFQRIGFPFDQDIKALLVQGDSEMINEVLKDFKENESNRQERQSRASRHSTIRKSEKNVDIKPPPPQKPKSSIETNSVNINEIDPAKPLNQTRSLLEFFLTGISKHMQLKPKQVAIVSAALLSNGNKYLAHVMVKGAKDDFGPVVSWLSEIYANIDHVLQLMTQNEMNIGIFFSTVKPGLLSKEAEVSVWTLRTYSKVLFELANLELAAVSYEWFTREQGGLSGCFMCVERHINLLQQVCDVLIQVSRFNRNDFFSVQFRKILDQGLEYMQMVNTLLECLCQSKQMKDELLESGLVMFWCELSLKNVDSPVVENRIVGVRYLSLMWLLFPLQFEDDQNLGTQTLFHFKRATRQSNQVLKYVTLKCMFRMLDHFARERNPYAAVVYKKLTFSLVENFNHLELRDFMEANFSLLFIKYSTIPIEILLDPLSRNCQVNEPTTQLNLCDFKLLKLCMTHPRMTLKLAITVSDMLARSYLNDPIFGSASFPVLQGLGARFIEEEPMQEFMFKLAKVGLATYYTSAKNRQQVPRVADPTLQNQLQQQMQEANIRQAQKRSQIIELLKHTLGMDQTNMNEQLKPLLVHFYLEIKQNLQREDKGILSLLIMLGNPQETIQAVQDQWTYERTQKDLELEKEDINQQFNQQFENEFVSDPFEQLRIDEAIQEKLFLDQNNVGVKPQAKVSKNSTAKKETHTTTYRESSKDISLKQDKEPKPEPPRVVRNASVPSRVLDQLASIKIKKEEEEALKLKERDDRLRREQALQRRAQQDIQKQQCGVVDEDENVQSTTGIAVVNLEEEERREFESAAIALRTHSKAFKYLWSKYSNTTAQVQKKSLFGELQEQYEVIQVADIWRMCKDYSLNQHINRDELTQFVRTLNLNQKQINTLDYEGFTKLLTQLSLHIYSKPHFDLRSEPAGSSIDELVQMMASAARKRNENSLIFEDPDNTRMDPDREMLREINWQLQTDPDIEIPNKFKKVTERELTYTYDYRPKIVTGLGAWLDCHSILSGILSNALNIHLIEPTSEVRIVSKARRKPQEAIRQKVEATPSSVARSKRQVETVLNKVVEDKIRSQELEELRKQQQDEKFRKHQESVRQNFMKLKNERERVDVNKKEEERMKLIAEAERERLAQERQKREAEERKRKLQEYKEKMQEDKRVKDLVELESKKTTEEQKRKEREQFMRNQQKEVHKMIEDKNAKFKEKEEKEKIKAQQQQEEQQEWKKSVQQMLKEEQEIRAIEKQAEQKIQTMVKQPNFTDVFKKNEKALQAIYVSYQEYSDWRIDNAEQEKDLLQFKGFTNFLSQFNLVPAVMTPEQGQLVFNAIARERERNYQQDHPPANGMNQEEFNEALLRVAIKGQKSFDLINKKQKQDMKLIDMMDIVNQEPKQKKTTKHNDDLYGNVDQTTPQTLEGLLQYLDLPADRSELQSKLRALKQDQQKVPPRDKKRAIETRVNEKSPQPTPLQRNKSAKRNTSASRKIIDTTKKGLAEVDVKDMKPLNSNVGVVGPQGRKENWQVQK